MFDLGFFEILTFAAFALIILGPQKLPLAARTAGKWYIKFRYTLRNIQQEIEHELDIAEVRKQMQEELAKVRETEVRMQQEMQELRSNVQKIKQETAQVEKEFTDSLDDSEYYDESEYDKSEYDKSEYDTLDNNEADYHKDESIDADIDDEPQKKSVSRQSNSEVKLVSTNNDTDTEQTKNIEPANHSTKHVNSAQHKP